MITRSSLETHKLDLMAEISSLKIRLATAENERRELEERLKNFQHHVTDLEARLALKDAEAADLRQRLARNGTVVSDVNEYEVERLKKAVDALMVSNAEKDKRVEELRKMLRRYKKIEEILAQAQGRKVLEEMLNIEDDTSSTSSTTPSMTDTTGKGENGHAYQTGEKGDKNYSISPNATSTPVNSFSEKNTLNSPPSTIASVKPTRRIQRSNSAEDITPSKNHKTPPSNKRHTDVVKRNGSYAHSEVVTDDEDAHHHTGTIGTYHPEVKKKKGLLRFFGRLKRSGSQDFHERERTEEFRRGGIRATATARLGWSRDARIEHDSSIPFSRWDRERIVAWMNEIGLNMYLSECRRWVRNGEHLLKASPHDIEKELCIRHPLHRKKLQLAIQDMNSGPQSKASILDHTWVMRWLDDIGLPQYKDNFFDARVDGRMLHTMTVEDLLNLKVANELHHISIKRGIQILRLNDYNSACLRRRPSADEGNLYNVPGDVVLWTNHRVMEWLRTIDLSEYAPNLRGSGVHGALMVLESRFNAELFAQLLSIPNSKTLLRRHLSTHFVSLVGNEIQHKKREQEATPGNIPLVPNAKIKKGKFGIFGHKRSKSETEADSFICPLDLALPLDKLKSSALSYQTKEQDAKAAQEIGAYSKEITSLTHQLGHESFFDSVPSSNV